MDPELALAQMGGVANYRDLLAVSSRKRIRRAVNAGRIDRPSLDNYCLAVRSEAVADARRANGVVGELSAALHYGWAIRMPSPRTVVMTDVARADRRGWATSPIRTIRDCAMRLPFDDALSVADSALRGQAVGYEELCSAAQSWAPDAQRVARFADGKAKNPFESSLRAIAIRAGLNVAAQWQVDVGGRIFHPDVADPVVGLALEADSWSHHAKEPSDHERDCERYNLMVLAGWRVLRFTWMDVMFRQESVIRLLSRAMNGIDMGSTRSSFGVSRLAA